MNTYALITEQIIQCAMQ